MGLAGERWFTGKVALGRGDDTVTGNHQFRNSAPILSTSMFSCLIGQKQRYVRNERLCTRNHSVNSWFQTNVERWFSVHVQTTFTLMNSSRSYCSPVNLRTMLLYWHEITDMATCMVHNKSCEFSPGTFYGDTSSRWHCLDASSHSICDDLADNDISGLGVCDYLDVIHL